jgi:ABC-type transport system substrate-binding protein
MEKQTVIDVETGRFLAPAGAGPFRLQEFAPERRLALRVNPDHWDAANIRLVGIDFLHTSVGPQRVNALRTGRIPMAQDLTVREAQALARKGGAPSTRTRATLPTTNGAWETSTPTIRRALGATGR